MTEIISNSMNLKVTTMSFNVAELFLSANPNAMTFKIIKKMSNRKKKICPIMVCALARFLDFLVSIGKIDAPLLYLKIEMKNIK